MLEISIADLTTRHGEGAYVLDVTMRGRGAASVPFEIRAGATTDVEVEIEPTPAKGK